jgi:hypothetical protein
VLGCEPILASDYLVRAVARIESLPNEALDDLTRAGELDPSSTVVWQNRAYLASEVMKDDATAIKCLNKVLELQPFNLEGLSGRAVLHARIEGRLHLTFSPLGSATQSSFSVDIVNAAGVSVKDKAIIRSDGSGSIELYEPVPSTTYYISVKTNPNIQHSGINYLISVNLATQPLNAAPLFSGSITGNGSRDHYLSIHKTQLYHFDLLASGGTSDNALQMTVIDLRTGLDVFVIATPNQVRRGDAVWLDEGHYMIRFTPRNRPGSPNRSVSCSARIAELSDDQVPRLCCPQFEWSSLSKVHGD